MAMQGPTMPFLVNLGVDATLTGSLLILLALVLHRLGNRLPAAYRHHLWRTVMLGLVLTLPVAMLPRLHLGLFPASSAVAWLNQPNSLAEAVHTLAPMESGALATGSVPGWLTFWQGLDWMGWLVLLWAAGAALFLARFLMDLLELRRLAGRAISLSLGDQSQAVQEMVRHAQTKNKLRILRADEEITPMSWGCLNPTILLPKSSQTWSEERRELVLLHEWGHILQKDFPFLMLGRILHVVFWFNPLVCLACRYLAQSREKACDDLVLGTGVKPSIYADHLLEIARSLRMAKRRDQAALSMARLSELEGRLIAILDCHQARRFRPGGRALRWLTSAFLVMGPLLAITPWRSNASLTPGVDLVATLDLTKSEWCELEEAGIDRRFVQQLVAFGFRDLDVKKIIQLRSEGVHEDHLRNQADLIYQPLTRVTDVRRVCMRGNAVTEDATMPLEIEGRTYYARPRCALLLHRPGFRVAVDPISGTKVDKATAVLGAGPNGDIFYFESEANLKAFNKCKPKNF